MIARVSSAGASVLRLCLFIFLNLNFQHKRGRLRYHIKILTDSARLLTRACPLNLYKARVSGDARHQCIIDNI